MLDYIKRFKQQRDVMKIYLGKSILDEFVENQELYRNAADEDIKKLMKEQAYDEWMAYLVIRGSDENKYGLLKKNLMSQYSLGNDQYPKTIQAATDALSNHKFDQKFWEEQKKNKSKRIEKNKQKDNEKNEIIDNETSFAQKMICYCCGQPGHLATECPKRDKIPREEWHVNKAFSAYQDTNEDNSTQDNNKNVNEQGSSATKTTSKSSKDSKTSWSGFQCFLDSNQEQDTYSLKDMIILDNGSTMDGTFMNPDLVEGIKDDESPVLMKTNAGTRAIDKVAEVNGFGEVYFDEGQMANIFGFAAMVDKADRVFYDSSIEDAFIVYKSGKTTKFKRTPEGLYAYIPGKEYKNSIIKRNEV